MDPRDERRYALLRVEPEHVLAACFPGRSGDFSYRLSADLPDGVIVEDVHQDWRHRSFTFRLAHASFAPVPPGEEPPRLQVLATLQVRDDPVVAPADWEGAPEKVLAFARGLRTRAAVLAGHLDRELAKGWAASVSRDVAMKLDRAAGQLVERLESEAEAESRRVKPEA